MKIITPTVDLIRPENAQAGIDCLRFIEKMARISHRSEEKQTLVSWERFITAVVLEHGDWSVVEHSYATVVFRVNRGVTHELVRHRLFSFTQESTRFVNGRKSYPEGLEFIPPLGDEGEATLYNFLVDSETAYFKMLDQGYRPQEARAVLPNALAATIAVTGNLRNWRHLLLMRTSKETHPDFKEVTLPLLALFKERVPLLFDDIEPEQKQSLNMRLPR
jgi:thymidylate synthase (FAD)